MTAAQRQRRHREKIKSDPESVRPESINGKAIQQCFRRAWGKSPSIEYCESFSQEISRTFGMLGGYVFDGYLGIPVPLVEIERHAKQLLADLHPDKLQKYVELVAFMNHARGTPDNKNRHLIGVHAIKQIRRWVNVLLDLYGKKNQRPFNWRDLACMILDGATCAWREGHGHLFKEQGRFPKSVNAHDPLCLFVCDVLDSLGIKQSVHTVSAVLRQRRREARQAPTGGKSV